MMNNNKLHYLIRDNITENCIKYKLNFLFKSIFIYTISVSFTAINIMILYT